jgi:hypothetical protein
LNGVKSGSFESGEEAGDDADRGAEGHRDQERQSVTFLPGFNLIFAPEWPAFTAMLATQFTLSYPTALKYRRKIAALAVKLGIAPPGPCGKTRAPMALEAGEPGAQTCRKDIQNDGGHL